MYRRTAVNRKRGSGQFIPIPVDQRPRCVCGLAFAGPSVSYLFHLSISHVVVISMLFPNMLNEPVQDLNTSQVQRQRCHTVS